MWTLGEDLQFPSYFHFSSGRLKHETVRETGRWPKTVKLISKVLLLMNSVKYQLQSIMKVSIFVDKKNCYPSFQFKPYWQKILKCFTYVSAISLPCSLVLLVAKTQTWRESNLKTFNSPWKLSVGLSRVSKYHSFVAVVVFLYPEHFQEIIWIVLFLCFERMGGNWIRP